MKNMKTLRSALLLLIALFAVSFNALASDDGHKRYCSQLKEKLGIVLTAPAGSFDFLPESSALTAPSVIGFGDSHPDLGPAGFVVGPTVKLNKNCSVVMMDVEMQEKPRPAHMPAPRDYTFAHTAAWMLNNCGEPWAYFYIYNIRGVRNDAAVEPSPEELRVMQEKVDALRAKYERCIEDCEMVEKMNCERAFIVRIPDIEIIGKNPEFAGLLPPGYIEALKSNATQCYGVEFYRKANYWPLKMLFFINADEISIDECVADMAEYIKFEDIDFD